MDNKTSITLILIFLLLSSLTYPLVAQDVIYSEEHSEEVFTRKWGPNKKHHASSFLRLSAPVNQSSYQTVKVFGSLDFAIGARYKRRFCDFYSTGFDLYYSTGGYNLKTPTKPIGNYGTLSKWDKERYSHSAISGAWYHRFNYGRRGNHLGKYFEAGVYGQYHYILRHRFEGSDIDNDISLDSKWANLHMNRTEWGFQAGFGFNKWKLFGQYRWSDYLTMGKYTIDLPPLKVGLEVAL